MTRTLGSAFKVQLELRPDAALTPADQAAALKWLDKCEAILQEELDKMVIDDMRGLGCVIHWEK